MKRVLSMVVWIAAGISIIGLAFVSSAGAGTIPEPANHSLPVHIIDLHNAYKARLGHTKPGRISGIIYGRDKQPGATGAASSCTEPNCPVVNHGGLVQHSPHVYLLLWGPNWLSDPNQEATATYLKNFYSALGVQPDDNWSRITSQYGDGTGHPQFTGSVYEGVWQDISTPPFGVNQPKLAAEADAFASSQGITDLTDAQVVVATQSGTCPVGFEAPNCNGGSGNYCAWHSSSNEPYTNLPYILDAGTICGEDSVNPSNGTYDGLSIVGGHEYAESITDPYPNSGWIDKGDPGGGEIADKCAWSPMSRDVSLVTGSFAMQPLWSNSANSCVMSVPTGDVRVTSPGNQSTYQGSLLRLQVSGISKGKHPLTWSATGLPSSLTISSGLGQISGRITAIPDTYYVSVSAADAFGGNDSVSFSWTVTVDVGTPITNQGAGKCLNDYGSSIVPGNRVVLWGCKSGAPEKWTHPANTGELIVLGHCLTDPGKGGAKTRQDIEPCTGAFNQEWYHNSKDEYVIQKNLLCLTDPNGSTANGSPVDVAKCTGAKDQQWTGS